jgi:hypothetical protein
MTAGIDIGPTRKRSAPQGCQAQAGRTSTSLIEQYHVGPLIQSRFTAWQREATRLAKECLRTGRERHRLAFERHVGGMSLAREGGQL